MRDKQTNQGDYIFHEANSIATEKALRSLIPSHPKILDKRIQSSLDFFSLEFISVAKAAFLATNSQSSKVLAIDVKRDLKILKNSQFIVKKALSLGNINNTMLNASLYFMAPGLGHGLRINGTLARAYVSSTFNIEDIYFHCARAAARAEIWKATGSAEISETNIIQNSPFLLLKTMNTQGKTELSSRGDEPGFVKTLSKHTLLLPERPGNKIAVSLRNIIACPEIEILFLVPNSNSCLNITGKAKVISDQTLLKQSTVNGKMPKTGILIHIESFQFINDLTFAECGIWDNKQFIEKSSITSFPKALSAHINGTGLLGKATNAVVSTAVKHDMKNLY